ncbi:MAG TPA: hypothetical protein VKB09_14720, partial [Thermomicrobiales bacterium]|nr:hypothetical protein [Thermomicrobiales bacterium]
MTAFLLAFTLSVTGLSGFSQVAAEATPVASPETGSGYAHPEWLADTDWLSAHLTDPALKVVALTPPEDFAKGHVPGAAQIDWPELNVVETS